MLSEGWKATAKVTWLDFSLNCLVRVDFHPLTLRLGCSDIQIRLDPPRSVQETEIHYFDKIACGISTHRTVVLSSVTSIFMAQASKTINPLHFEDLEPHRFEDLVRQLAYDFRPWRRLEATGRAGSDDGFDARGHEIVATATEAPDAESDEEAPPEQTIDDRAWLIQCKRARSIGPKKLLDYLHEIPESEVRQLHGILFVAPCEFSKKARDGFYARCTELGIAETHLWGKAELEDQLFQAKNDHLLFAYFGFSLQIRKRSIRGDLRSLLSMKRKAHRMLGDLTYQAILLRDPSEKRYPFSEGVQDFDRRPPWRVTSFQEFSYDGLKFRVALYVAHISDNRTLWDAAMRVNYLSGQLSYQNPWHRHRPEENAIQQEADTFWNSLPENNRAHMTIYAYIPYDKILDIDDIGDEWFEGPHVFVPFDLSGMPFVRWTADIEPIASSMQENEPLHPVSSDDRRAMVFPDHLRQSPKD